MPQSRILIKDGSYYTISNVAYPSFAMDLIDGNQWGTIAGYKKNGNYTQLWKAVKQSSGSGDFVFQTVAVPDTYVLAYNQYSGISLVANSIPNTWTVNAISRNVYQIKSTDGEFMWVLAKGFDYYPVSLRPSSEVEDWGEASQWKFEEVQV